MGGVGESIPGSRSVSVSRVPRPGIRRQPGTRRQRCMPSETPARFDRTLRLALWLLKMGPLLILALLILVIAIVSPVFLTTRNIGNVLAQTAVISVLAMGQLLVIVTSGIDLSVGSVLALAPSPAPWSSSPSHRRAGDPHDAGSGVVVGLLNGFIFVKGRLPHPFIITLATLSIARGLALWLSDGRPIQGMPEPIQALGGMTLFGWLPP